MISETTNQYYDSLVAKLGYEAVEVRRQEIIESIKEALIEVYLSRFKVMTKKETISFLKITQHDLVKYNVIFKSIVDSIPFENHRANFATTQLETVNVNAGKEVGLGNQHPSSCSKDGEGSTTNPGLNRENGMDSGTRVRDNQEVVVCKICGYSAENIVLHLKKVHKLNPTQYKQMFGDVEMLSDSFKNKSSENMKHNWETGNGFSNETLVGFQTQTKEQLSKNGKKGAILTNKSKTPEEIKTALLKARIKSMSSEATEKWMESTKRSHQVKYANYKGEALYYRSKPELVVMKTMIDNGVWSQFVYETRFFQKSGLNYIPDFTDFDRKLVIEVKSRYYLDQRWGEEGLLYRKSELAKMGFEFHLWLEEDIYSDNFPNLFNRVVLVDDIV